MTGEYQHSLDNKGRLFIPAKLREELGEVFFLTLSMDRCLCAYSAESWRDFSEKVAAMPYIRQRRMRPHTIQFPVLQEQPVPHLRCRRI